MDISTQEGQRLCLSTVSWHTCQDIHKSRHALRSAHSRNAHMNRVTLVTEVYSLQKKVQRRRRRGEEREVEGRKNYYHPLPSLLIKSITSNMFLMMVKAGGNWFIWRCFKVDFSQVERGSLKPCKGICVCEFAGWNVHVFRADLNVSTVKKNSTTAISLQMLPWPPQGLCVYLWVCLILQLT